jgi:hypothetical protein
MMLLDDLLRTIPVSKWPDAIPALSALLERDPLPRDQLQDLFKRAVAAVERGRRHTALALFAVGLLCDQERWIESIQREGLLRPSKQRLRRGLLDYLVRELLRRSNELNLSPDRRRYLDAVRTLNEIDRQVQDKELRIEEQLTRSRYTIVRSCLVLVDLWFFAREIGTPLHTDDPLCEWAEELADGFSFLYYLFARRFPPHATFLGITNTESVLGGECLELLNAAKAVRVSRELEILVERFGYRCFREDGRTIVESPDASLEKSIQLGYTLTNQEKGYWAAQVRSDWRPQLADIAEHFYDTWKHRGVEFLQSPYARLRFQIPEVPEYWTSVRELPWLAEEVAYLEAISQDFRMPVDDVLNCSVVDALTLRDLLLLQRLINFVRYYINCELRRRFVTERTLVVNSLVPVFPEATLARVIGMMLEPEKVPAALRLLVWESESKKVFDLMYQPVIVSHHECHVPLNVFGSANVIRNTLQMRQLRVDKAIGLEDPLEDILVATLSEAGIQSFPRTKYEYQGARGDIDVIAIFEDVLFIFECKGSLHPCNTFELRASYDLLRIAEQQLDRISPLLQDPEFLRYLGHKLDISLSPARQVVNAIVTGNRMFAGWRAGKYPVRSLLDLMSFINSGVTGVAGQRAYLRPEGPITVGALLSYVESDLIYTRLFEAMEPIDREAELAGHRVVLRSFQLNCVTLAEKLGLDAQAAKQWISVNEHLVERTNRKGEW